MSKVVILEKDFDLADNIKEILSYKDYEVCSIGSGINSKALINQFSPSFVILGTRLNGGKDGIETARDIRKDHSCPLLFLSTNETSESIKKLIKRIPNSFILQKPFSFKSLHLAVDRVMSPNL
ncbi:response regulator [Echinicola salinicaeni]|uniref:response regulator n=1 Tax=Echinicola salinicaeni TaxID=2762757 RepID=UPI001647A035|nr:response regulator [Echinicola salinicaeni]